MDIVMENKRVRWGVRRAMAQALTYHTLHTYSLFLSMTESLAMRVVDLQEDYLVDIGKIGGYMALSYVWGSVQYSRLSNPILLGSRSRKGCCNSPPAPLSPFGRYDTGSVSRHSPNMKLANKIAAFIKNTSIW